VKGECCDCLCGGSAQKKEYKIEYLAEMLDKPAYLASAPPTAPTSEGFRIGCFCWTWVQFPPGFFVSLSLSLSLPLSLSLSLFIFLFLPFFIAVFFFYRVILYFI
jgi:hypothetical protein